MLSSKKRFHLYVWGKLPDFKWPFTALLDNLAIFSEVVFERISQAWSLNFFYRNSYTWSPRTATTTMSYLWRLIQVIHSIDRGFFDHYWTVTQFLVGDLTNICFDKASIAAFLHQNLNNHDHKTVVETINFSFTQLTD